MTDRDESERDLDRAIERIVAAAASDAPDPPDRSTFEPGDRAPTTPSRRQRLAMVAALVLVVGAGGSALLLAARDGGDDQVGPVDSVPGPSVPGTDAGTIADTGTIAGSPSDGATTASQGAPDSEPAAITRPVTDPSICVPASARDTFTEGLTLFARPSANPVPVQIVGDPDRRLVGPFAVVQRYFGDDRPPAGDERIDVGGTAFSVTFGANGNGAVEWDVGDGSTGYVRSRGLDRADLFALLGSLSPRDQSAAVPGFDVGPLDGLAVLHEQMNTTIAGEVGSSQCDVEATGYRYRISAINGDRVFQYGGVIDRPTPLAVGMRGSTLIVIDGIAAPSAPTVADVVEAEPDVWLELRSRPEWPEQEGSVRSESIGEGFEVVVPLASVDGTTERSYLTLRLRTVDGIAFLEVDTADAVLAADAAFWRTDLDPGGGGLSTAGVGEVLGYRVGEAPVREEIEVTVSVIDGGEFVLQSTGTITLNPV